MKALFVSNYIFRDRMPGKANKEEFGEYEYWIDHQNNAEFLDYLAKHGVDTRRNEDVLKQEQIFEKYMNWVKDNSRTPKNQRHKVPSNKYADLPLDLQEEDFLYRWQSNVLNNKIKCLSRCRIDIRALVIKKVAELKN